MKKVNMEKYISNKHKLMKETKQRRRRRKLRDGEEKSCYGYNNKNEEFKNWQKALNGIKRINSVRSKSSPFYITRNNLKL